MEEVTDLAQLLHDSPDIFPWVVLAIILIFLYFERGTIRELINGIINSRKEVSEYHARNNELIRNNTAALENNTAVLQIVQNDRKEMIDLLKHHEELSKERDQHIQKVVNRIDDTTRGNRSDISIIADRTER